MMNEIYAGQHIYGNVEKDRSPTNNGGFQTLFYTKSILSPSESDEIESRMGYYFSAENPEKFLFFEIGSKFITTRILPLPDVDKFGRKGLFIAHSFVFKREDIEKIGNNPFAVFNHFKDLFVHTTAEALSKGVCTGQDIHPIKIALDPLKIENTDTPIPDILKQWNPVEIKNLISLVMTCGKNSDEAPKEIVITGSQPTILDTLQMIFSLLPDRIRSSCTFDTYFLGCNPVAIKYRIYCYPSLSTSLPQFTHVDAEKRTISNVSSSDTESQYINWIYYRFSSGKTEDISQFRNTAFELDQFLSDKKYDKGKILKDIQTPTLEKFLEINQISFQSKISRCFAELVPNHLAGYVINSVKEEYAHETNALLLEKILNGYPNTEIAEYLFHELKKVNSPSTSEIEELREFLTTTNHTLLRVIYLKWIKNFKTLSTVLKSLTDDEFKTAISLLVKTADIPLKSTAISEVNTGSPYMNWLLEDNSLITMEEIYSFRNVAFEIDQFLLSQNYNKEVLLKELKSPILEHFLKTNQKFLQAKVPEYFNGVLSPNLAKYVIKSVIDSYSIKPDVTLLEKLLVGFERKEIGDYLYNKLKQVKSPTRQEIKELRDLLTNNHHIFLQILYLTWVNNPRPIPLILKQLNDDEYRSALEILLGNIEFQSLFVESKIEILVNTYLQKLQYNETLRLNLVALIKMILTSKQEILLQKMIPFLPTLKRSETHSIQEYIRQMPSEKQKNIPREFIKKMDGIVEKYSKNEDIFSSQPIDDILLFFKRK